MKPGPEQQNSSQKSRSGILSVDTYPSTEIHLYLCGQVPDTSIIYSGETIIFISAKDDKVLNLQELGRKE